MAQWEAYVEKLRVALPAAPDNLLDGYVRWIPWVYIVLGVLGVIGLLVLLPFGAAISAFAVMAGVSGGGTPVMAILFGLILSALKLAAGYLMLKRSATGWWIAALGLVVNLLTSLLSGGAGAFGLIITLLIAYLHVQVRPRYS
jgi:hypothetical protein